MQQQQTTAGCGLPSTGASASDSLSELESHISSAQCLAKALSWFRTERLLRDRRSAAGGVGAAAAVDGRLRAAWCGCVSARDGGPRVAAAVQVRAQRADLQRAVAARSAGPRVVKNGFVFARARHLRPLRRHVDFLHVLTSAQVTAAPAVALVFIGVACQHRPTFCAQQSVCPQRVAGVHLL